MNIRGISWLFLALSSVLFACEEQKEIETQAASKSSLQVEGFVVKGKDFESDIKVTANLLAHEQVELKAPIAGTVLGIYFKEGQKVNKGKLLVRVDDRAWKAQLSGLKAQLVNAKKTYDRKEALLEIEGSSQEELDLAKTNIESLEAQIQELQVNIALANIKAPFSGTIGMRDFSVGAYVKEGDVLTTVTDLDQLKVDFNVPEEYFKYLEVGQHVQVLIGSDTVKAKIYAVNPRVDELSRTINVRAWLKQNKDQGFLPGSFAEVLVATSFQKNALMVPSEAIVPEIDKQTVYISKNGKVIRNKIALGARTADLVHVLEGVSLGDTIITTGLLQVREGMSVDFKAIK